MSPINNDILSVVVCGLLRRFKSSEDRRPMSYTTCVDTKNDDNDKAENEPR